MCNTCGCKEAEEFGAEALVIPDGDSVPHHILYRLDREGIKYRFIEGDYGAEEFGAESFEAREDLICDYCEKIISPDEGSVNWPDSGLTVCDDCFDDAIKNAEDFEATKGMDTYAQPLEELKIKPTKTKVGILLASIVAGGLWYSNKMKE